MQHVALILDTPNKNNRLYPKKTIEHCLPTLKEQINKRLLFVTAEEPITSTIPIHDIVAEVKDVFIDGNRLIVDFEFLREYALANAVQEELNRGNISLRTSGVGTVSYDDDQKAWVVNSDFEFLCFCFTYTPA